MGVTLKLDDLPEDVVRRIENRAVLNGRSLQAEAAAILEEAAMSAPDDFWEMSARILEETRNYKLIPSEEIIREMRDR